MKIHYISCHEVLEYDEVKLLTELGHDVFANGAYILPTGHPGLHRPGIPGVRHQPELEALARNHPRTNMPPELIDPFDVIIVMHSPDVLDQNWRLFKKKRVIYRSIGQSSPTLEVMLDRLKRQGLEIVRYSPMENRLPHYAGMDQLIRFYKPSDEYTGWHGTLDKPINITQNLKGRRGHCHHDEIMRVIEAFDGRVYGPENDDLGNYNGGKLPYHNLLERMREARCMVYGGTWPAAYTLSFIEAWMMGLPIVAINADMAHNNVEVPGNDRFEFYEIEQLIEPGVTGFIAQNIEEMIQYTKQLLDDHALAQTISANARKRAVGMFGKKSVRARWRKLLGK